TTADQESEVGSESSEQGLDSEDGEEAENPEGGSDVTDLERPDVGGQLNIFDVIESEFSADTTEQADLQILDTTTNVTFSGVLGFAPLEDVQVQILGVSSNVGISTLLTASSSAVETLQIEEIQIVAPQPLEEIAPSIQAEPTAPPPDNPPIAADDVITLRSSQSIDVTDLLLANDNDPDEGQTLSIVDVSGDQSGNLILSDGRLTVNPDEDLFLGLTEGETVTELFSYTVASADSSATGTVTLVYEGINDSPVISDFLTDIGELAGPTTFLPEDLLAPSFDPDRSDLLSIEN
ncbi:MAG: Ig-like domain-containing protein, partial [Gammaproteobacteria bacterium]